MGSILITQEGIETSTIDQDKRNKSLLNFYMMLGEAVKLGDRCFITESALEYKYSYGEYYPAFVHLEWEDFQQITSLSGVSQSTYEYITNSFLNSNFYPEKIAAEKEFEQQNMPRGEGGFEHSDSSKDFLCNISNWEKWHRDYLTAYPEEIQWKSNSHLSNIEAIYDILEKEVLIYIKGRYKERINKANDTEQEIKKIWNELFADKKYHKKTKRHSFVFS